ncbi:MAG: hypothetical protein QW303_09215 [Nitrososphaerota archaeon]
MLHQFERKGWCILNKKPKYLSIIIEKKIIPFSELIKDYNILTDWHKLCILKNGDLNTIKDLASMMSKTELFCYAKYNPKILLFLWKCKK